MNADVKKFLESGLLEQYLIGETNGAESQQVEHYLATSAKVRSEYEAMQSAIEKAAKEMASMPPDSLRSEILREVNSAPKNIVRNVPKRNNWAMAASVAALIFGGLAFYFWGQINELKNQNLEAQAQVESLNLELEKQATACQELEERFRFLSHPDTRTFRLNGNNNSPEFQVIAYWNETAKSSLVNLKNLPKLPKEECFQIWADVDGEMLSVGIFADNNEALQSLKYLPEATSLNVTIEPKGGSEHPNVSRLVANVAI